MAVGILVILARWAAGKYFVNQIVANDAVRPAADSAWGIITQSLAAAGWVALVVGILVAAGAWLVGPGARATAARGVVAPHMRRPEIAWGAWAVGTLLILWILPIVVFRTSVVLVIAVCDRLLHLPAPTGAGVACSVARGASRTARSTTGGRELAQVGRTAVVATAVEHDLVGAHPVVEAARCLRQCLLETGVGERLDLPALVADEMVVILPVEV